MSKIIVFIEHKNNLHHQYTYPFYGEYVDDANKI